MQEMFIKMIKKLGEETFGTWAYQKQVEAMEDGKLKLSEDQPLCDSIDKLFAINKEIPYLSTKDKIILKTLLFQAMAEFV